VLKSGVKEIPGIGWGLQLAGFLFIYRNWEKDQRLLGRSLDYFKDLGKNYQVKLNHHQSQLTMDEDLLIDALILILYPIFDL